MRTKKWALTFLVVFAGIILFAAQSALGGSEVATLDLLIVGKAPGTKLEGPITVFYEPVVCGTPGPKWIAKMYWFMRLKKGYDLYQFAGGPKLVEIPTDLVDAIPDIIGEFIIDTVIPTLYSCNPTSPGDCPDAVLKSYDLDVDWEAPGYNSGLFFFIADIVIAVQD
jgi:hypothetical protein